MTKKEAIKYLKQLYPNGGHCWLDDQRMEAIGMAVKVLQEEPVSEEQVKEDTMTISKEWFEHCKKSWYNEGYIDGEYNRDRQFEKERLKLCDNLTKEQAKIEQDFVVNFIKNNNSTPTFIDAIEYGMKMQKEQMMVKAVDGIARPDDDEVWCDLKSFNFKDGDKVKVLVIKED